MRKDARNWLIATLVIIGVFFLLNSNFNLNLFATVITPSQEYPSPYTCPSGQNVACNVKGIMKCEQARTSTPLVVARSDDSDYSKGWLAAYDTNAQSLASYCYSTTITTSSVDLSKIVNLSYGVKGYLSNGPFNPCRTGQCIFISDGKGRYWEYIPSSCGADLTPSPKYNCQNQELCKDFINKYSCGGEFRIEQSSTDKTVIYKEDLFYSSNNIAGEDASIQKTVNPGNVIYVAGGDRNIVISEVVDTTQSCTKDKCSSDNTGVIKCINQREQPVEFCSANSLCIADSLGAKCGTPVKVISSQFVDASGNPTSGYKSGEQIKFRFTLSSSSSTVTSAIVNVQLQNSQGGTQQPTQTKTVSLSSGTSSQTDVVFGGIQETGSYFVVLDINYGTNGKVVPAPRYELKISNPITLTVVGYSESAGSTTMYSNEPAIVEIRVSQNGQPVTANLNLVTKQGGKVLQNPTPSVVENSLDGFEAYIFKYNLLPVTKDELLSVDVTGERNGYTTTLIHTDFQIKQASVQIEYTNIGKFVDIKPGVYTIEFQTKTPQGELIDSENRVNVIVSGKVQDITSLLKGSDGIYSFDYNFELANQGYFFEVISSADELGSQTLRTKGINVIPEGGGLLQCVSHDDCSYPQICQNSLCVSPPKPVNYLLYIIIAASIFLIIVIIKIARKKKSQVSPSLTGL